MGTRGKDDYAEVCFVCAVQDSAECLGGPQGPGRNCNGKRKQAGNIPLINGPDFSYRATLRVYAGPVTS